MFNKIKDFLLEDTNLILDILDDLECNEVNETMSEIRASLPSGSNNTSIRIRKNEFLAVEIFSRADFDEFEIKDIFALVQYIRNCSLTDATKYICGITGIEYDEEQIDYKKSASIKEMRRFKPKNKNKEVKHKVLDDDFMKQYQSFIVDDWVKEGISKEAQSKFEVCIDKAHSRWVFPIRDDFGNLISTKGRTYVEDYDLKGIFKYIYYPKMGFNDILFGYYLTAPFIYESNEIIVVEAEKSVMKAWSFGVKNTVASGKAGLNYHQINKIIRMQCKRVVLAYDKDIGMNIIQKDINALRHYKEVYYVLDELDLLGKKDAPVDKGYDVWYTLYELRKRGK
jgi:DNA primase